MKNNIKGFTIVQLMLVLFLTGGAFAVIAELLKQVNVVSIRGREGASLASLQDMFSPMRNRDKMADFINTMRSSTSWFNSCLPNTGSSYSCPVSANISAYPELQSKAASRYVFEADIVDLNGKPVAGTSSSPVYYDDTGSPCVGSKCRFESKGFAIINSTVDPGDVTLASVIIQNPLAHQRGTVWKARYTYFEIGTFWKTSASNSCPLGQYVSGLNSDHNVVCTSLPVPSIITTTPTSCTCGRPNDSLPVMGSPGCYSCNRKVSAYGPLSAYGTAISACPSGYTIVSASAYAHGTDESASALVDAPNNRALCEGRGVSSDVVHFSCVATCYKM